jgi:hypothetical protein
MAQPADVLIFPGAQLDQEVTGLVHQIESEVDGTVHTWVYATDARMDEVIAFYVAHGYRRHDAPDWETFTQETVRRQGIFDRRRAE